jgi:hypothetical protein
MVPDDRKRIVDLRVVEEIVAESAVVVCFSGRCPVNRKAGMIFSGYVGIETPVVLLEIATGWVACVVFGNIGDVRESTADARVIAVDIGEVLLAQAGGERRTNVQALSGDGLAVYTLGESGGRAVCRGNCRTENGCALEIEIS